MYTFHDEMSTLWAVGLLPRVTSHTLRVRVTSYWITDTGIMEYWDNGMMGRSNLYNLWCVSNLIMTFLKAKKSSRSFLKRLTTISAAMRS